MFAERDLFQFSVMTEILHDENVSVAAGDTFDLAVGGEVCSRSSMVSLSALQSPLHGTRRASTPPPWLPPPPQQQFSGEWVPTTTEPQGGEGTGSSSSSPGILARGLAGKFHNSRLSICLLSKGTSSNEMWFSAPPSTLSRMTSSQLSLRGLRSLSARDLDAVNGMHLLIDPNGPNKRRPPSHRGLGFCAARRATSSRRMLSRMRFSLSSMRFSLSFFFCLY